MKISTFVIKTWRFLSLVMVLAAVGLSYSVLPDDVGVHFNTEGKPDEYLHKSDIFYLAVAIIIVNNTLIMALGKKLLSLPSNLLPIPNQIEWAAHRDEFNEHLKNWFFCLIASINTILGFTLFALGTVNSNQFKYKIGEFGWLFYMTFAILFIVGISLPIRLLIKPKND